MDTLEAPRLSAAPHPFAKSDTAAFYPPKEWEGNKPGMK